MALADKTLVCRDCGQEFVFSTGEQEFYQSHGLQNEPYSLSGVPGGKAKRALG